MNKEKFTTNNEGIGYLLDSSECFDKVLDIYNADKSVVVDKGAPFISFNSDMDSNCIHAYQDVLRCDLIAQAMQQGISMEDINKTFGKVIKRLDEENCFDAQMALKMSNEQFITYIDTCPELEIDGRFRFVFNEEEMEQIFMGIVDGIDIQDILDTYCQYNTFKQTYFDNAFDYIDSISLYNAEEMAQARKALLDGVEKEKILFALQRTVSEDIICRPFDVQQIKTILKCFKDGLSVENMNDILIFKDAYKDEMMQKVCICTPEEIAELAQMI